MGGGVRGGTLSQPDGRRYCSQPCTNNSDGLREQWTLGVIEDVPLAVVVRPPTTISRLIDRKKVRLHAANIFSEAWKSKDVIIALASDRLIDTAFLAGLPGQWNQRVPAMLEPLDTDLSVWDQKTVFVAVDGQHRTAACETFFTVLYPDADDSVDAFYPRVTVEVLKGGGESIVTF